MKLKPPIGFVVLLLCRSLSSSLGADRVATGAPHHRNAGITSLAKSRIDFIISAWGMPPKLNVVVSVSK
jgi:hypothetical protein